MCCSSNDPKGVARLFVRIGFGLALAFAGFAHYQDATYAESVGRGLGVLEPLGMIWGYILPGLMIIGGLLLAFGIYRHIAAYAASIALASIPAGLMLKSAISGISMDDTMPPAMNALIWILVLMVAVKGSCSGCCGSACGTECACGPNCDCGDDKKPMPMAMPKSAPKSAPVAMPMATKAAAPAKKVPPKKKK
jgi:hypothetical protein